MVQLKFRKSSCHCNTCNAMCKSSPCWPTPEEAKRLQAAYPNSVAYDESYSRLGQIARILRPRSDGELPMSVNQGYAGRCVFFNNQRCDLHYTDLKPLEGRLSSHEQTKEERGNLRRFIGRLWLNHTMEGG